MDSLIIALGIIFFVFWIGGAAMSIPIIRSLIFGPGFKLKRRRLLKKQH